MLQLNCQAQLKLDSTFATNGVWLDALTVPYATNEVIVEDAAGNYYSAGRNGIRKINNNGSTATAFGNNGMALFPYDPNYSWYHVVDMKLQRDGKIVVLARAAYVFVLMRYNTNGTIDNTFNGTGILTETLGVGMGNVPKGLAIDTTGDIENIYVCGSQGATANSGTCANNFFVCKIKPNGTYDNTFHNNGQWIGTSILTNATSVIQVNIFTGIHIIGPNNIILTGYSSVTNPKHYMAVKIDASGVINSSFGTNGYWKHLNINNYNLFFRSMAMGTDKIVLSMQALQSSSNLFGMLLCLDTLGQTPANFGIQGEALYDFGSMYKPSGLGLGNIPVAIDKDKNIFAAFYSMSPSSNSAFRFVKLDTNGAPDLSFGINGTMNAEPIANDFCMSGNIMNDIKFTKDNKILLAFDKEGTAAVGNFTPSAGIYRYIDVNYIPTKLAEIGTLDVGMSQYENNLSITTKLHGQHELALYNMQGAVLLKKNFENNGGQQRYNFQLPNYAAGHYVAIVTHNSKKKVLKISLR